MQIPDFFLASAPLARVKFRVVLPDCRLGKVQCRLFLQECRLEIVDGRFFLQERGPETVDCRLFHPFLEPERRRYAIAAWFRVAPSTFFAEKPDLLDFSSSTIFPSRSITATQAGTQNALPPPSFFQIR